MKKHNYIPIKKVDKTENLLRYRIIEPNEDLYIYRTKKLNNGVYFVFGIEKQKGFEGI